MAYKIYKALLWVQGIYSLITALWGLIDIDSFMAVTGHKADIWLVKTVSVILVAVSLSLIINIFYPAHPLPIITLGALNSLGLAFIDFYYALNNTIFKVYMLDGVAELIFFITWIYILINQQKVKQQLT